MTRRCLLLGSAAVVGCRRTVPRENLLPAAIGPWKRTALETVPSPDTSVIPQGGIRRVQRATYEGEGKVEVSLYELKSSAVALDAVQRWRPAADTVFFYRDDLFVVVRYESADRKAVNAFVAALDKHLTPPR